MGEPVQDPICNIGGGIPTPNEAIAGLHQWCGLDCSFCGHWVKGQFTKDEIANWLRIHRAAGITPNEGHTTTESTCPHPCGTPFDDEYEAMQAEAYEHWRSQQ